MSLQHLASPLLHFLWQGTLVAAVYGIVRSLASKPEFRYTSACGALAAMALAPIVTFLAFREPPANNGTFGAVGSIASSAPPADSQWLAPLHAAASGAGSESAASWIVLAWLAGALLLFVRLIAVGIAASRLRSRKSRPAPPEWQQTLDALCHRMRISRPVRLVVSAAVEVPGVVGWLRPVVLAPVGALTGLDPDLIEAVLAHELAHIRRHDFAVNALQSIVEAALYYHPAVWWLSRQIRAERELCCDDLAVAACGDALLYARALSEMEGSRRIHLNPALAVNGGSLRRRIARLLGSEPRRIAAAPLIPIALLAGLALAPRIVAQPEIVSSSSLPAFEVASVKPSDPDSQLKIDFAAGGRLFVRHATLRFLIKIAYDVTDDQLAGGPGWVGSARFDVQARPSVPQPGDPATMSKDELTLFHEPMRLRLQRLLAERFQLELTKESKPMPIFALVAAKPGGGGIKMKLDASPGDAVMAGNTGYGTLKATRVDMDTLARFLNEGQTGRPVVNRTGLRGRFDFTLEWAPDSGRNPSTADPSAPLSPPTDAPGVSIFTALTQQLGLKLEAQAGSADRLVITRAAMPSAN
jgi:uncharacterized protein (TIGR03435 family)